MAERIASPSWGHRRAGSYSVPSEEIAAVDGKRVAGAFVDSLLPTPKVAALTRRAVA
jgi:hypothetical protein